jgi:hypothetical protein
MPVNASYEFANAEKQFLYIPKKSFIPHENKNKISSNRLTFSKLTSIGTSNASSFT